MSAGPGDVDCTACGAPVLRPCRVVDGVEYFCAERWRVAENGWRVLKSMLPKERVIENPIDPRVMDLLHTAKNNVEKVGGRPEVIVVSELDRTRHLKGATEVLGMRVAVRAWMPDDKLMIESERDLAARDAMYAYRDPADT